MTTKEGDLSRAELQRYSRHLMLPELGRPGQVRLKSARVLLVGAGGLGSPVALYLAAAGIGTLGIVDPDVVDATNLQRQVLHGTADIGRPKTESAAARLSDINPHVTVERHAVRLTSANALQLLAEYDVVVDGTDNFPTRYLVNDACALLGKPNVYGSIFRFEGQVSVFDARTGPCYRCLFREPPPPGLVPSCAEGGVLGVLPGIIGSLQALETIKLVTGVGEPLIGRLLLFDGLRPRFRQLTLRKDPRCPVCGDSPTVTELIDYEAFCGTAAEERHGANGAATISPEALRAELDAGRALQIVDVREPHEWDIVNLSAVGARLVPMGQLEDRSAELDVDADLVVYCRSGARSARAARRLLRAGFRSVRNLEGGILGWIDQFEPDWPRY